jgi:hypothetical protein
MINRATFPGRAMSIRVTCPKCRAAFACPDEYRGKTLRCKKCGQPFVAVAAPPRQAVAPKPAAPTPTARRGLTPRRFAVAALLAMLLGGGIGLPAAWFLLKKHHPPDEVAAGQPTAPAEIPPAARPTEKQEPPRDTGTKPPPVPRPPVEWTEYTKRDCGFSARFPGEPKATTLPSLGGKPAQSFEATASAVPGRKAVTVSVTCEDREPRDTADPAAFLAARAAELGREGKTPSPLQLSGFPGVEVRIAEPAGDWLTTHRFYVVRSRAYHVVAGGPTDKDSAALARQFLDSFALFAPVEYEAAGPPAPPASPPVVAKPGPPKGGLAELELTAPRGWQANYNKFLGGTGGWELKKPPPTPRSEGENVRIEPCPPDATAPADYAAHLKEKDWLNVDVPGFIEVGPKEDLPDGFVIKGVIRKFSNAKTPPVLGFVAVRDLAGMKVRCYGADLRSTESLDDTLEAFKAAKFAAPK